MKFYCITLAALCGLNCLSAVNASELSLVPTLRTDTVYGGMPNAVGAGARGQGMGYAFTAIADDATANTWNPAGMSQLERPEFAVSLGFTQRSNSLSNDQATAFNLDHASVVLPFHAFGIQQTIGIAWQRQLDFTGGWRGPSPILPTNEVIRLIGEAEQDFSREGSFATVSASYAIEPFYGFSLGVTYHRWDHSLSGDSSFDYDFSSDSIIGVMVHLPDQVITIPSGPPIIISFPAQFGGFSYDSQRVSQTRRVKQGQSVVIGALWHPLPYLSVGAVVRPSHRVDVEVDWDFQSWSVAPNGTISGTTLENSFISTMKLPTAVTLGTALRFADTSTLSVDIGWTQWSGFSITESGRTSSAVHPNLSPNQIDDDWTLRVGYEHLILHPTLVSAWRIGAYYEGLPGLKKMTFPVVEGTEQATTDAYFGLTIGTGIFFRSHLLDLSAELRMARGVGAGQFAAPTESVNILDATLRMNYTFHF